MLPELSFPATIKVFFYLFELGVLTALASLRDMELGTAACLQGCKDAIFKQYPYCFLQGALLSREQKNKQKAQNISEQCARTLWMKF